MQVIKPIGAILIHSAYINSEGAGYHRCRNIISNYGNYVNGNYVNGNYVNGNYVNGNYGNHGKYCNDQSYGNYGSFKRFAVRSSFGHNTGVIESDLPSIVAAKFEPPLPSREDKLKHLLSSQLKQQCAESLGLGGSGPNGTGAAASSDLEYVDEFNRQLQLKKGMVPDIGNDVYDASDYRGRSYAEIERFKDMELRKIRSHEMRNGRIFKSKNLKFEEKYRLESEDGSRGAYNREYWTSQGHDVRAANKGDHRKRNKRAHEPIEVRLSLRIHEADLLNKCKFFKKKALKGYPLNFMIRVDGNPDEFMLAAEGILNKARMFLSDACMASGNLSKSNTTISLYFRPLNRPEEEDLSEHPSATAKHKNSSYLSHLHTQELPESYNMGGYSHQSAATPNMSYYNKEPGAIPNMSYYNNEPGAIPNMSYYNKEPATTPIMNNITVVPTTMDKRALDVASIFGNNVEAAEAGAGRHMDGPLATVDTGRSAEALGNTRQVAQEKTSRFMTLNKKKESRWIVKHSKDETSSTSSSSSTSTSSSSTSTSSSSTSTSFLSSSSSTSTSVTTVPSASSVPAAPTKLSSHGASETTASTSAIPSGPSSTDANTQAPSNATISNTPTSSKWKVLNKRGNLK
nr:hypothetical protein MACL_00001146 [Theileria orientalis]